MNRKWTVVAAGALLSGALVACSSSGDSTKSTNTTGAASDGATASSTASSGLTEAADFLNTVQTAPTTIGINTPLSKAPAKGKTIISLTNGGAANVAIDAGMRAGAEALGWTFKEINTGATPEKMQGAMTQAIQLKPDGITYSGIPTAVVSKQLDQAQAAGIPVVATAITDPKSGPMIDSTLASPDQSTAFGKAVAAYVATKSSGQANVALFSLPAYPILTNFDTAFKANLHTWCPTCAVTVYDQQITDIGTKVPASVVSALQRNTKTNWVLFDLGDVSTGVAAGLKAANLSGKAKIAGAVPEAGNLAAIKAGTEDAWMAYPVPVIGMRIIDDFARKFNGDDLSAVAGKLLPQVLITADNLKTIKLDADGTYPGPPGAINQFKTLWKVG